MNVGHISLVDTISTAMRYHLGRNVFSGVDLMKKSLSLEFIIDECNDVGTGDGSCCVGGGGGRVLSIWAGE